MEFGDGRQTERHVVTFVLLRVTEQVVGAVDAIQNAQHPEVIHEPTMGDE